MEILVDPFTKTLSIIIIDSHMDNMGVICVPSMV